MLEVIKDLKNLEGLQLNVTTKDSLIKLVNQNLNKESRVKKLDINFILDNYNSYTISERQSQPSNFDIKFPLYMKHL